MDATFGRLQGSDQFEVRVVVAVGGSLHGAGSSQLGRSLRRALTIAAAHPDHENSLVIFSDFQLFDHDLSKLYADLAAFDGNVHAVVLRASVPVEFQNNPNIRVTQISYDSPVGAVAHAVFDALTEYRPRRELVSGTDKSRPGLSTRSGRK